MVIASFGFVAAVFGPLAAGSQSIAATSFDIAMRSADEESRRTLLQMILLACDLDPALQDGTEQDGTETATARPADGTAGGCQAEGDPDRDGAATTSTILPRDGDGSPSAESGADFAREILTTGQSVTDQTETVQQYDWGSGSLQPNTWLATSYDGQTTQTTTQQTTTQDQTTSEQTATQQPATQPTTSDRTTSEQTATQPDPADGSPDPDDQVAANEQPTTDGVEATTTGQETAQDQAPAPEQVVDTGFTDGLQTGGDAGDGTAEQSGAAVSPFGATVVSGRVTTLDLGDPRVAGIEVLKGPAYGNLTVNPDNTLALVLTGETRTSDISVQIRVTYENGTAKTFSPKLDVAKGPQAGGWGLGDFYMLETDASDRIVVEHGENHRKVYVSGSDDALSRADIAALEGLSRKAINQRFFLENPDYGATEDMAVTPEVASLIWRAYSSRSDDGPSSNWMLFERGYAYDGITGLMASGESALNPVYYGAYGRGADPVLNQKPVLIKGGGHNIVFQDIDLAQGVRFLAGSNILLDHVSAGKEMNIQNIDGFTLRHADVVDVVTEEASGDLWSPHKDRVSGIYTARSEGILIEDSFFDHNGWEDGYDYYLSAEFGQPPSQYSHNVYLQVSNLDVTFRDNIVMRAAADGAQLRSGGYVEDNIFIDNNNALLAASGGKKGNGNYSLLLDNVVTSAGHKDTYEGTGGLSRGIASNGYMPSMVGNIVAHLSDPNNLAEWLAKRAGHFPTNTKKGDAFYDDTVVHNWVGSYKHERAEYDDKNANTDGLRYDVLDRTTIQIFTAKLLGRKTATIEDLADYLRAQAADGALNDVVDADLIIGFFRKGFGLDVVLREEPQTLRFVPNDLGEGMRWDNRLNWTSETLPGASPDDDVELGGNWVVYGGTTTIDDLSLGAGGRLTLTHGRLDVEGTLEAGAAGSRIVLDNAGQLWLDTYEDSDTLRIEAAGGRFVNTDMFRGMTDLVVSDDAQVVLATGGGQFALAPGSSLTVRGGTARLGVDSVGSEAAILTLGRNSDLRFESQAGELGLIREFYSGAFGSDSATIRSGIDLGGADLTVDVSALPRAKGDYTLVYLDEVIGSFDDIRIVGLGSERNATVTVNYELDAVVLSLGKDGNGTGRIRLETVGSEADARTLSPDIWDALIDGQTVWSDPLVSNPDTTL